MRMFTFLSARALNDLAATPGTPIIPTPEIVTRVTWVITDTAFTTLGVVSCSFTISVPSPDGLNVFFTLTGTPVSIAGSMLLGWRTFAPK